MTDSASTTFNADGTTASRYSPLARTAGSLGVSAASVLYAGASVKWAYLFLGVGALLSLALIKRVRWGDRVTIDASGITIASGDVARHVVPFTALTHVLLRKDILTVVWQQDHKQCIAFIPGESFVASTYSRLRDAIVAAVPADKLKRES